MGKLWLDSYVVSEGFGSTEEYIVKWLSNRDFLKFGDFETFLSLRDEGLVAGGAIIRTSDGMYDRCYSVNLEGELLGLHFDSYPLDSRIYTAKEVFADENIVDGYVFESRVFPRLFREWYKLNKK